MRKPFLVLTMTFLILSCNEVKNNSKELPKDEVNEPKEIKKLSNDDCLTDFNIFFKRFAKDSLYQKSKILFPLEKISFDYEASEDPIIEKINNSLNFRYIDFSKDSLAIQKKADKFTIKKEIGKDKVIYKRIGYDNGLFISYEFKIIAGCWNLVKITDEST